MILINPKDPLLAIPAPGMPLFESFSGTTIQCIPNTFYVFASHKVNPRNTENCNALLAILRSVLLNHYQNDKNTIGFIWFYLTFIRILHDLSMIVILLVLWLYMTCFNVYDCYMTSIWFWYDFYMTVIWLLYHFRMTCICRLYDVFMTVVWLLYDSYMIFLWCFWLLYDFYIICICFLHDLT